MAVKKYKPVTAGTRCRIGNAYAEVTTNEHKKKYRIIDFRRGKKNVEATVKTIEYDPNRTCFIALVEYADGELRYMIAPQGLQVGAKIISGDDVAPEVGNALPMKNMPLGTNVHNIEMQPGQGGKISRSAGSTAQLTNKEDRYAVLKMPSGELRKVLINCYATVGVVSNSDHSLQSMGKAGRNRWRGIRPRNRGVAMNPVDHPMGGGEGKASGGQPRSRNGQYSRGLKTRKPHKGSDH